MYLMHKSSEPGRIHSCVLCPFFPVKSLLVKDVCRPQRSVRRPVCWRQRGWELNSLSPKGKKQEVWGGRGIEIVSAADKDCCEAPEQQRLTWLVSLRAGVRFCSWIDWRRVIRNFLSSPSWAERRKRFYIYFYNYIDWETVLFIGRWFLTFSICSCSKPMIFLWPSTTWLWK